MRWRQPDILSLALSVQPLVIIAKSEIPLAGILDDGVSAHRQIRHSRTQTLLGPQFDASFLPDVLRNLHRVAILWHQINGAHLAQNLQINESELIIFTFYWANIAFGININMQKILFAVS